MESLDETLTNELKSLQKQGLSRKLRRIESPQGPHVRVGSDSLINFSSNDYLNLANDPILADAGREALETFGVGSGASRLISGSLAPHHVLEDALASFKGTESALCFSSGYATALGVIPALLGRDDLVILDKRIHASVVDAARLSGAKLRVYPHNDLNRLEDILKWMNTGEAMPGGRSARKWRRRLIVTESVFSMDGDLAPLREIVELKERHGAWLMLDEAHATGLFGENRRGLAEAFSVSDRVDLHMGTLGKALGVAGGFIAGSRVLIDYLINRARSFIFSTAPLPAASAAALAAVRFIQSPEGEQRQKRLWSLVDHVKSALIEEGWRLPPVQSPILPLVVGMEYQAVDLADQLKSRGVMIPAIRYPTVARGSARLRLTVTAGHSLEDIGSLQAAMHGIVPSLLRSPSS